MTRTAAEWAIQNEIGDFAIILGFTPPPNDDGFWFREESGPVHDDDLRGVIADIIAINQLAVAALTAERDKWEAKYLLERSLRIGYEDALERSAFDVSPCGRCGLPVICIPDGLPFCSECAKEEM